MMAGAVLQLQAQADDDVAAWDSTTWRPLVYEGLDVLEVRLAALM